MKVIRSGQIETISISQVYVGDLGNVISLLVGLTFLVVLETGDWVPADGVFVEGHGMFF